MHACPDCDNICGCDNKAEWNDDYDICSHCESDEDEEC